MRVHAAPVPGSMAALLAQTLAVGPNTRLEFRCADGIGFVDAALPRADDLAMRGRPARRPRHALPPAAAPRDALQSECLSSTRDWR